MSGLTEENQSFMSHDCQKCMELQNKAGEFDGTEAAGGYLKVDLNPTSGGGRGGARGGGRGGGFGGGRGGGRGFGGRDGGGRGQCTAWPLVRQLLSHLLSLPSRPASLHAGMQACLHLCFLQTPVACAASMVVYTCRFLNSKACRQMT